MNYFPTTSTFRHAVVKMSNHDRFTENNVHWRPYRRDEEGWLLREEGDSANEQFISHAEVYAKLQSGNAQIRYRFNAPETQRVRAIFGAKTFADINGKRRALALFRQKLIDRYDAECVALGKKPRWSKERFEENLRLWRKEIISEMLGLDEEESNGRADKMTEVVAFKTPSVKTFLRDYKRYHAGGADVLAIVHRHHGPGLQLRRVDAESMALAHKEALEFMTARKPSRAHVYRNYLAKLFEENATREKNGQPALSRITRHKFESIISNFDEFDKWDGRHGRASALKHFTMARRSIEATAIGERIEIDFWNVDLMSLFVETGMWTILPPAYKSAIEGKRIWFVAAIDVATRYILAFRASLNPNGASAAAAIRMIMTDKRHISTLVRAETPWMGLVRPREIFSDNGREFANDLVEEIMRSAGITFSRPQAGRPAARPFIESFFHSIGPLIAAYFDGRTFRSIEEKGDYDPEQQLSLEVGEVITLFNFAVCDIYHNKPHSGLGGRTPHNAWVQAAQEHGIEYPSQSPVEMLHIFGQRFKRRIGKYGISFMGISYGNEELHRQRAKYGQMEFEIKVDPENIEHIAVRGGDKGWFVVRNTAEINGPVSLAEWIMARTEIRQQRATEAEVGLEAMFRGINRLRETGKAAALRANLTPRHLTAKHYEIVEADLFGAWEAVRSATAPALTEPFALQEDPLRGCLMSDSTAIPQFKAERERYAAKSSETPSSDQQTRLESTSVITVSHDYYEEY